MGEQGYEFFEHTADAGLRVYGKTLRDLFVHAAQGFVALVVEDSPIAPRETRPVVLNAESVEALLRAWLKELLFWFSADRFLPGQYRLDTVEELRLQGQVSGERFDLSRHTQGVEVKGVTHHQFQVTKTPNGWEARVIFDI